MYRCCLLRVLTFAVWICSLLPTSITVTHERNLIWAQKDEVTGVSRLVGVTGDPHFWVPNRTATTKYITSPKNNWKFKALGFDFRRKTLYWSETGNKKIQGLQLNGSHAAFSVFEGTSSQVDGVAVDWTVGNIYWTDALYNWIVLAPGRKDSSLYSVIVDTDLDRPSGIAVAPHQGLLFWSDWGIVPKIERSTCAGEGRRVLVSDDVAKPLGMTLDNTHDVIYWTDGMKSTIETVDIYGNNRKTMFLVDGAKFFGITLYQNYVFVTEQDEKQLYVFDLVKSRHEVKFSTGARPYDVMMYDNNIQPVFEDPCIDSECDHVCVSAGRGRHQCLCAIGYNLDANGKSCADDGHFGSPQFVYSIGTALCRFPGNMADMSLTNVSLDTQCFLTHRRDALALAAHIHQDEVFISENKTRTISVIKLAEGEAPEVIVGGTGSVEGLAVDWVASNIYWTDAVFKQIMVARTDGRFQMQLVSAHIERPRGIAVDPVNGHVYWTDVGRRPRIERALLDGSKRSAFVSSNLGSPNHIVLDFRTLSLCWADSTLDRLECIGLNGKRRRVVIAQPGTDMYGVTIFQDFIIWTDQNKRNGIHAGIRDTGQKVRGIIHPGIGTAYDVITYDSSLQPLVKGPCGDLNGGCEQLCLATPRGQSQSFVCQCAMGFVLGANRRSCIADAYYDNFLLFSDTYQKQIYQMSLASEDFHAIPLESHDNPIAVDYDPLHRKVYWSDVAEKVIKCAFLNGTGEWIVLQLDQKSIPDGLALEPSSRLAYYTDTGLKVIGAVTLDSGHHHVIIDKLLDQPRAVVLDPGRGHMYWTDWGLHSRIEKANMDGSSRRRIINTGLGAWPNGLAIDPKGERLYWCDARSDRIETASLDGHDRRVIFRDAEAHFFGMATLAGSVFYTDWTKKSIMRIDTLADPVSTKPIGPTVFARLNDVHVYKSNYLEKRYTENACGYRNGGCSHLCLPIPSGRTCACPEGMTLVSGYRCVISNDMETTVPSAISPLDRIYNIRSTPRPPISTSTPMPQYPPSTPRPKRPKQTHRNVYTQPATKPTPRYVYTRPTRPTTTTTTTTTTTATTTTHTTSRRTTTTSTTTPMAPTTTATTTTTTTTTTRPTTRRTTTSTTEATTLPTPTQTTRAYYPYDRFSNFPFQKSVTQDPSGGLVVETFTRSSTTIRQRTYPNNKITVKPQSPNHHDRNQNQNKENSGEERGSKNEENILESTTVKGDDTHQTERMDDFEFSMFALLAIIIGGIVLMFLIVASAIVLYKKMDPGRPRRRRIEPPLSTLSDMYEMPDKERRHHSETYPEGPGSRYGYMHDRYYNGDLESASTGMDGFSRRDSMNTYEEILEDSNESRSHMSFSTFR